ncbi:MAG: cytochrome c [Candidatus Lernaella stagnicola]|nr:cytochrome c [Candidatus Lernaella stagnicola]
MKQRVQWWLVWGLALCLAVVVQTAFAKKKCETNYDNFGKAFMEQWCSACHTSAKKGPLARQGAPKGYDFDQVEVIKKDKGEILEWVIDKSKMPPGLTKPTDEEKAKLKTWLDCEY